MPVSAVSEITNSTGSADQAAESGRVAKKTLGQKDFLELLAVQLSSQDPLNPMQDTDFIAQMANFSSLEMMNSMNSSVLALGVQQSYMNAQTLLGRSVTVALDDGTEVTGIASEIKTADDGSTMVTLDGVDYPASSVVRISLPQG